MPSQARGVMWGTCAAIGVLIAGSLLPVWVEWHFSPWEGVGYSAPLHRAMAQLPANARDVGSLSELWKLHLTNLVQGGILLAVATGTWTGAFWLASKRRTL